jgi:hypothetical protein
MPAATVGAGSSGRNTRMIARVWRGAVVFYPEDERFLVERDLMVRHFEAAGTE